MKANDPEKKNASRAFLKGLLTAVFWVLLWQIAAMALNQKILLAAPADVFLRLLALVPTAEFWKALAFSFSRIACGFLLACAAGTALAALAAWSSFIKALVSPLISVIKSTPVASFIILVLLWVPSKNLSVVISFLMVVPIVYSNVLTGVNNLNKDLQEMAEVFEAPLGRRLRYLYLPQLLPFFRSACAAGLGLCWKAGVAAEVIGLPKGSVGERLYQAKIYLETPDLFAWTLVIILISILFEKVFLFVLDRAFHRFERV